MITTTPPLGLNMNATAVTPMVGAPAAAAAANASPSRFAALLGNAHQAAVPAASPAPASSPAAPVKAAAPQRQPSPAAAAADADRQQAPDKSSAPKPINPSNAQKGPPARPAASNKEAAPQQQAKTDAAEHAPSDATLTAQDSAGQPNEDAATSGTAAPDMAALLASLAQQADARSAKVERAAGQEAQPTSATGLRLGNDGELPSTGSAVRVGHAADDFAAQWQALGSDALNAELTPKNGKQAGLLDPDIILVTPGTPAFTGPAPDLRLTSAPPDTPLAHLSARPGSADFGPQLGAQLSSFVRNGIHHAQLELNPAEMGPLLVQIQLDGNNAHLHLAATHTLTREALAQSMPLLASSLREAGLTLTGGGVSDQPRPQDQNNTPRGASSTDSGVDDSPIVPLHDVLPRRRGVVDLRA